MARLKREYIAIPNDPIIDHLQPIFDRETANLQYFRLEMLVEIVEQKKGAQFENAFNLVSICGNKKKKSMKLVIGGGVE